MEDVTIIGSGPAGLSAGLYAARYQLETQIIGQQLGGAMAEAWQVENYPGFLKISGLELAKKMKEQVEALGVKVIEDEVTKLQQKECFLVFTRSGKVIETRAIILALGTQRRKLNISGEARFLGRGVSYCATCDGPLFKNKKVAVVGGGDSAIKTALLLEHYASEVFLLVRGEKLKGEPLNIAWVQKTKKIKIFYQTKVLEIKGDKKLESLILQRKDQKEELVVDGLFVEIGSVPAMELLSDLKIKTDPYGYVIVDENQRTNLRFVYAAGDLTTALGGFKQILTAAAQGAVAAHTAYQDLSKLKAIGSQRFI